MPRGAPYLAGKVAVTAVVGVEDGAAQARAADLYQALSDVGFSLLSQGGTYWNGQAMHTVDYLDLDGSPDEVVSPRTTAATNAVHSATLLKQHPYPAPKSDS